MQASEKPMRVHFSFSITPFIRIFYLHRSRDRKDTGRDDTSETQSIGAFTGFGSAPIGFAEGYASSMGESTGFG
jgi:hypothetical protein